MMLEVSARLSGLHNCPPVFRRRAYISATETRNMMTGILSRLPLFSRRVIVTGIESDQAQNQCGSRLDHQFITVGTRYSHLSRVVRRQHTVCTHRGGGPVLLVQRRNVNVQSRRRPAGDVYSAVWNAITRQRGVPLRRHYRRRTQWTTRKPRRHPFSMETWISPARCRIFWILRSRCWFQTTATIAMHVRPSQI